MTTALAKYRKRVYLWLWSRVRSSSLYQKKGICVNAAVFWNSPFQLRMDYIESQVDYLSSRMDFLWLRMGWLSLLILCLSGSYQFSFLKLMGFEALRTSRLVKSVFVDFAVLHDDDEVFIGIGNQIYVF